MERWDKPPAKNPYTITKSRVDWMSTQQISLMYMDKVKVKSNVKQIRFVCTWELCSWEEQVGWLRDCFKLAVDSICLSSRVRMPSCQWVIPAFILYEPSSCVYVCEWDIPERSAIMYTNQHLVKYFCIYFHLFERNVYAHRHEHFEYISLHNKCPPLLQYKQQGWWPLYLHNRDTPSLQYCLQVCPSLGHAVLLDGGRLLPVYVDRLSCCCQMGQWGWHNGSVVGQSEAERSDDPHIGRKCWSWDSTRSGLFVENYYTHQLISNSGSTSKRSKIFCITVYYN